MSKFYSIAVTISLIVFTTLSSINSNRFSINATIIGLEEDTMIYLLDGFNNEIIDSVSTKQSTFKFEGTIGEEPKNFVLYIPLENGLKYTYLFMANEDVQVKGTLNDFPNNLTVTGSFHHQLKQKYDKSLVVFDQKMQTESLKINELRKNSKWNDSLQKVYFEDNGILYKLNQNKFAAEKKFLKEHANTYFGMQVLNYKKNEFSDKELKKLFSNFSKKLQQTKNGKAVQAYLDNSAIKIGDKYADFIALNKLGINERFSSSFDGKKYVLLDFSTPTCPNTRSAIPAIKELDKESSSRLKVVTFYIENNKEHFDYLTEMENNSWKILWTERGKEGFPYIRYRINSTPTYYLFNPQGKLVEKWSGYKKGNYDDTVAKIKKLIQP